MKSKLLNRRETNSTVDKRKRADAIIKKNGSLNQPRQWATRHRPSK